MKLDYTHLKELVNRGPKNLDSDADGNSPPPVRNCRLHPLIHTPMEFTLAQNVEVSQRFSGFGSLPLQTGHTFSVGLIIKLALHLGHLTGWSLARLISSGSRLVIFIILFFSTKEPSYAASTRSLYRSQGFKSLN